MANEQSTVDDYLTKYIEGYLFGDLDSIVNLIPVKAKGAANYPMLMSVCSGIEILGTLVDGTPDEHFSDKKSNLYFGHYWKHYLVGVNPEYGKHSELLRLLVRNGLAHTFATKQGIGVTRHKGIPHLGIYNNQFIINANDFYHDFKKSYFELAKPRIFQGGDLHDLAQQRLNEMLAVYNSEAERVFKEAKLLEQLQTKLPANYITQNSSKSSGASGTGFTTIS